MMDNTNDIEFQNRLVLKIRSIIEQYVIPSNVLHVFHKYDQGVLTQRDIDFVRATYLRSGDIEGANELLGRLIRYNNWYKCLLSVLQDPGVKLGHAADFIKLKKDEVDREFNPDVTEFQPMEESSKAVQVNQRSLSTGDSSNSVETLMLPLNMSLTTLSSADALTTDSPFATVTAPPSDSSYLDIVSVDYPNAGPYQNEMPGNTGEGQKKIRVISDLPERNFGQEEVNVLSSLPGWHADIEDRQVLDLLKPHRREPGCYIIWYWRDKKRPAICVTHENEVKTLLVHKRPDPDDIKKVDFYFVNKVEKKCNSLKEIVEHHIRNGVFDLSKKPYKIKLEFKKAI